MFIKGRFALTISLLILFCLANPAFAKEGLCNEGYSTIFYLYGKEFTNKGTNHCSAGSLDYRRGRWEGKGISEIFDAVQDVLDHGGGPILAHCWNGRHAAGAVAAKAFIQFCGWSHKDAVSWWRRESGDEAGYDHVIEEIRDYEVSSRWSTSSDRCP